MELQRKIHSKKQFYRYYLSVFTGMFLFMLTGCFLIYFFKHGKAFFRSYDGLDQHYLIFIYIGDLLRDFFYRLFVQHQFYFPMWNMGIGYGSDILTSLAAYLPDPFNWIAVFFPHRYAEYGYGLMLILKIYICGLTFSWFCFEKRKSMMPTLIGAAIYMFSSTMYIIFIESFFVNPMYIFPFVIAGVDRIWEKNKPVLYVCALAFAFINYFYFAYMMCVLIFLYCLIFYIQPGKIKIAYKTYLKKAASVFFYSLIALGLSMVVVLPILEVLLNAGRLGVHYFLPVLFDKSYYGGLLMGFITEYGMLGRDCFIGYGCISLIFMAVFFLKDKQHAALKRWFILLSAGLCIPYFGHIMNGFSYTASRWVWAYAFCISCIAVVAAPLLCRLTKKECISLTISVFSYVLLTLILLSHGDKMTAFTVTLLLAMTASFCFLSAIHLTFRKKYAVIASFTALSLLWSSYLFYSGKRGNGTREEVKRGTGYALIKDNGVMELLYKIPDAAQHRYDEFWTGRVRNTSWLSGISGMDFYISIYNNNVDQFHNHIALLTGCAPMDYHGLDRRSDLEYLFNVKYFLVNPENKGRIPYGYSQEAAEIPIKNQRKLSAYLAAVPTSFVYGFSNVISQKEFAKLNPYEKQQALMQTCVADTSLDMKESAPVSFLLGGDGKEDEVPFNVVADKDTVLSNGIVRTSAKNGRLRLMLHSVKNAELYVLLNGIDTQQGSRQGFSVEVKTLQKNKILQDHSRNIFTANNKTHMYGGKHQWLVNLGIVSDCDEIDLVFPEPGIYQLKKIKIYGEPVQKIEKNIHGLVPLAQNFKIQPNGFFYSANERYAPYALVTIPYSKGWRAFVDGKERKIIRADDAFMMLPMEKKDKNVVFQYRTPGLLPGAVVSLLTGIGFFIWENIIIKNKKI